MVKDIWQLIKDTIVYGLGSAIVLPLGLLTLPIFTRAFVPDEFGVIELIAAIVAFFTIVLTFNMDSAVQRSYFDSLADDHKKEVISTGFLFLIAWDIFTVAVLMLLTDWLSSLIFNTEEYSGILRIALVTIPLSVLITFAQNTLRLHFSPWKFTIVAILNGVLTTGLSILLVIGFRTGLSGYFIGILAGSAAAMVFALLLIKDELVLKISWPRIREMLKYAAPLMLAAVVTFIMTLSNRFFISNMVSMADLGLYAVAVKISSIMVFINLAMGLAWPPFALRLFAESEPKLKQLTSRILKYILVVFFLMAIVLTIFISELLHLFTTAEYYSAAIAVGPLCFSVIALATMQVTGLGISLSRKTQYFPISAGIAAAVNVALNVLLIPLWGILGAAVATAASYTVLTICYLIFSQRLYPFKYDVQAIIKITMIGVAFLSIIIFFIINNIALNLIIKFGCVFLFIGALIALRVFDQEETSAIRQHLRIMKTKR